MEQAATLKEKGVSVLVVAVGGMNEDAFKAWKERSRLPFPLGRLKEGAEKARTVRGATALPWFILTDQKHRVTDEGFSFWKYGGET